MIFEDNQAAIKLTKEAVHHLQMKHLSVKFHKLHELKEEGIMNMAYLQSAVMPVDALTKALGQVELERKVGLLGLAPSVGK